MPVNDPHFHTGDRRTFDPSAMNTPKGSENFHTWMDSAHSRLSPSESAGYGYSSTDQIDYYAGVSPEMSAAAYKAMHGKSQPQGPHRG